MRIERKIKRRRFIRYMAGVCALFAFKPTSFHGTVDRVGHDSRNLLANLQRKVRRDFELGRTVEVDGWILSETEARLCSMIDTANSGKVSRHTSDSFC